MPLSPVFSLTSEKVRNAFFLRASGATLTEAGSFRNPLLIGSVLDTVSNSPPKETGQNHSLMSNQEQRREMQRGKHKIHKSRSVIKQTGASGNH